MSLSNPERKCDCQIYEICEVCTPGCFPKAERPPTQLNTNNIARIKQLIEGMHAHPFLEQGLAHSLGTDETIMLFALLNRVQRNLCPFAQEGYTDAVEGVERADCPYEEGTDGQAGWLKGWDAAKRLAEEKPSSNTPC